MKNKPSFLTREETRNSPKKIAMSCCEANVSPYLFEFSPDIGKEYTPAEILSQRILDSHVLFVLIGKGTERYWIQAWIGFEIGVVKGANASSKPTDCRYYYPQRMVILQNVGEQVDICIPWLNDLILFNFTDENGWGQYKNLVAAMTLQEDTFRRGNQFQENFMKAKIDKCKCNSRYDAWVAIRDAARLDGWRRWLRLTRRCKWISGIRPIQATLTIDCPSCDARVTGDFKQGL